MEWVSPEVEQFYTIFNKVYTTLLSNNHSYLKKIYIVPESFNEVFMNDNRHNDVEVIACADFLSQDYNKRLNKDKDLGTEISSMMIDLIKMVPNNEILKGRRIYPKLELNYNKDCEGLIEYTR
jgi:hypothetical protein